MAAEASQPFQVFAAFDPPLGLDDVRVHLSPIFNRSSCPAVDECIAAQWERRTHASDPAHLYNGLKFRYHSLQVPDHAVSGATHPPARVINLGITDFRQHIGTNAYYPQEADMPLECMAQALGVECLLVTSDRVAVFYRRSGKVSDMQGLYCGPGGHPEPKEVLNGTDFECATNCHQIASELAAPNYEHAIRAELFHSAVQEIVDEIGISEATLSNRGLCAVTGNPTCHLKPDLLFLVSTTLSAAEVNEVFSRRGMKEAFESEGNLLLLPVSDLKLGKLPARVVFTSPTAACIRYCASALR